MGLNRWLVGILCCLTLTAHAADEADLESIESVPGLPKYALLKPLWAIQIGGGALHAQTAATSLIGRPLMLQLEIQPTFLQGLGIVSIGPAAGSFFSPTTFYGGGMIRYQARFFNEQWIVPMVGYEFLTPVSFSSSPEPIALTTGSIPGSTPTQGIVLGGMFLLNVLERDAANQFFSNHGVLRTYLTAEYRSWFSGLLSFWHFGLRVEY